MTHFPILKLWCCSWVCIVCAGQLRGKTAGKHELCCPLVAITNSCGNFLSIREGSAGAVMQFLTVFGEKALTNRADRNWGGTASRQEGPSVTRTRFLTFRFESNSTKQGQHYIQGPLHGHCKQILFWETPTGRLEA